MQRLVTSGPAVELAPKPPLADTEAMSRRYAVLGFACFMGCGPTTLTPGDDSTSTSDADGGSTPSTLDSGSGASLPGTSGSSTTDTGPSSSGTDTGGQPPGEGEACDYVLQDCAPGLKCVRVDLDGDGQNERICVPVVDDPVPSGTTCEVDVRTGEDNCPADAFCSAYYPINGTGICINFCAPIIESYECDDPDKTCIGTADDGHIGCYPLCDPLAGCPDGQACVPNSYGLGFVCVPNHPTNTGVTGDLCYAETEGCSGYCYQCTDGHICLPELDYGPGCDDPIDQGCCTEYCDLTEGTCSNPLHECVPFFGKPQEHPNLGLCALPEDFDWCDGTIENPPPGQCPPADAEPSYPWCSSYDTSACTEGNILIFGGECGLCWCNDSCASVEECPVPVTGVAELVCDPGIGCSLLCDQDSDCPNGMDCHFYSGELRCLWRPDSC